ncbi:hypothetical protein AABC03_01190 [Staphylococcus nepalensis]
MSTLKEVCKKQTELLNECRQNIKELTEENERLERENECEKEWFYKYSCELEHIVKHERDTIKRLERENEKLKATNENLNNRVRNLNLNSQIQHDELMSSDGEVRYWKNKYTTLTNHIRDMKFASPYSYNYIHLVNFIKELERADDGV